MLKIFCSQHCKQDITKQNRWRMLPVNIWITQYTEKEPRDLIDELSGKHFVSMGDFSYPGINWVRQQCSSNVSMGGKLFLESVEASYIKQHVQCETRQDAILDLVFTDEEDMIDYVESLGPFASSDHNLQKMAHENWFLTSPVRN